MTGRALLDDLHGRGLVYQSTDEGALAELLGAAPVTVYAGFDPTADSLHLGHLVPLLLLRRFQDAGHRPIALAGGATGMIGDPSGRHEERSLLERDELDANVASISAQLSAFLRFDDSPTSAVVVDNRAWTEPLPTLDFLRDVGKHVTVNTMLAKESVRARVASESGISFTEFSYMLLQAHDFWWLHEHEGCQLQVGGSDQWGNITAGIDLVRRRSGAAVHGLTVPLVTRTDGQKFGKSDGAAVWLSAGRTSPYQLYQYFMNLPDEDVGRLLGQLTLLSLEAISGLSAAQDAAPQDRPAHRALAHHVTALLHGDGAALAAAEASAVLFGGGDELPGLEALELLEGEIPTSTAQLPAAFVDLVVEAGCASSRSDARRSLEAGEFRVNGVVLAGDRELTREDLLHGRYLLISRGRKRHHLLVVR